MKKAIKSNFIINIIIIFGAISFIIEDIAYQYIVISYIFHIIKYLIFFLYFLSILLNLRKNFKVKKHYKNIIELIIVLALTGFFIYNKFYTAIIDQYRLEFIYLIGVLIRNILTIVFFLIKVKKLDLYLKKLSTNPAQAIIMSFLIVIIIGTILLMMPISTANKSRIGFINALFTATSAVCVTGLIVVDTGSYFSLFGKSVIMILLQIGGLGIMILSYFSAFIIGKKLSIEDKLTLSYMINENDTQKISKHIKRIILITFIIELIGVISLFFIFNNKFNNPLKAIFYSFFHSISAFCNAGFSLFSDSFEQFKSNVFLNFIICSLIILGGLSFGVLTNFAQLIKSRIKKYWLKREQFQIQLSLNSKVVFVVTLMLLITGMLIIYQFEHSNLVKYDLKTQYLSAFFQSVTLRTAGFNTIKFNALNTFTYLIMILYMFIGGAAGSTAGGVKVNTIGTIYAYIKSIIKDEGSIVLMKKSISSRTVNNAFLIITLYLISIFFGVILISISDGIDLIKIIFEVVSAIGTVGLSTGITSSLTSFAKIIIVVLMFFGRIGPLTILTAMEQKKKRYDISYPEEIIHLT